MEEPSKADQAADREPKRRGRSAVRRDPGRSRGGLDRPTGGDDLRIWVKQYRNAEADRARRSEHEVLIDQRSSWAPSTSRSISRQERRRPAGREIDRDGQRTLYELATVTHPIGPVDRLRRDPRRPAATDGDPGGRDLFGRRDLSIEGVRPVVATAEDASAEVRRFAEAGRHDSPVLRPISNSSDGGLTDVAVGDPITLTLEIEDVGDGPVIDLANLRPLNSSGPRPGRIRIRFAHHRHRRGTDEDLHRDPSTGARRSTEIPAIAPSFDPELGAT